MTPDSVAISAVISWAFGVLGFLFTGLVAPFFFSLTPDAVALHRRSGDRTPLIAIVGLSFGLLILGGYLLLQTGDSGTPSPVFWGTLGLLSAVAAMSIFIPLAATRAWRRGRARKLRNLQLARPLPIAPQSLAPGAPALQQRELTWREAEFLAAEWMRHLGAESVEVTPERRDGGIDVVSSTVVAQVKCYRRDLVGVDLVRQLVGVASTLGRPALFFATTSFTPDAQEFARKTDTALFVMRPLTGQLIPIGPLALSIHRDGLVGVKQTAP